MSIILLRLKHSLKIELDLKKLILFLALSATIVTFLNSFYSSYQVQKQQLQAETLKSQSAYAAKLVSATDRFLQSAQQQLAYSAKVIESNFDNTLIYSQEVTRLRLQTDSFNSTVIVLANGMVKGISPKSLKLEGKKLQSYGALQALSSKEPMISEPYISAANNLIIFISHPLFASDGRYLGYVGGSIYLKHASILNDLLQVHFHKDGSYLYVVDKNRRLLYHPNTSRIGEQVYNNEVIEAVLSGKHGTQQLVNSQNEAMLAGYAPLQTAPWGIITQRPLEATLEPLDGLMINVLHRTLPIGLATLLFIWLLARFIAHPLRDLAQTANALDNPSAPQQLKVIKSWYFESSELRKAMLKGVGVFQNQIGVLRQEAQTDPLTGLHNRRSLDGILEHLTSTQTSFAVLAIDIDFFKHVNDEYGHDIGDLVLQSLANIILDVTRTTDFVTRTGGEEFIVISPNATATTAYLLAERLRMRISETFIGPVGYINVSVGIAGWPLKQSSIDDILRLADQALYKAKRTGRNRSVLDSQYQDAEIKKPD
ncbi:sensor domain-containing diguanylate cyclase [Pseudoalteromonas prydzensis]|uniref:sensor domain-containing diguanylate cyclase n=1 Tax=Pseudoalteromonas prydzensis TaxID=182141 RepID=UPI001CE47B89|nr:sensor domain-containing diguanylate cyclase [Pseudoalteromonas prydzensis]